jgi:hypothetical protein
MVNKSNHPTNNNVFLVTNKLRSDTDEIQRQNKNEQKGENTNIKKEKNTTKTEKHKSKKDEIMRT